MTALRPTQLGDLEFVLAVERHQENRSYVSLWTSQQHESALTNPDMAHFIVTQDDKAASIGYAIVAGLNNPNRSLELKRIAIVDKGQGHGRRALQHLMQFAFAESQAHRLWLDVKSENHRARHLYTSEGFIVEGILRECLQFEGRFESLVVMSMLRNEYFQSASDGQP